LRLDLLDLLACPSCRGELELSKGLGVGETISEGEIICLDCRASYPVKEGIPCFLSGLGGKIGHIYRGLKAYYDAYAPIMDRNYHNPRIAYMRSIEDACIRLTKPRGLVLDIGCGTGRQTIMLAEKGCRVLAMDISMGMLLEAKRRVLEKGLLDHVDLLMARADALPIREGILNRAYSIFGAYNHAPGWLKGFRQVHRALRERGAFLLTVLNYYQLTWWAEALLKGDGRALKHRLSTKLCHISVRMGRGKKMKLWTKLFTPGELLRALKSVGFRDVRLGSILLFLKPRFSYRPWTDLRGHEIPLARLEDILRWYPPFNRLGAYIMALARK